MKRLALLALLVAGCTDRDVPIGNNALPDASLPNSRPDAAAPDDAMLPDAAPPIEDRYLFLVETSNAMAVLDKVSARAQSVLDLLTKHAGQPTTYFSVMAFDSVVDRLPYQGFTRTPDYGATAARLHMADKMCDDEAVLDSALQAIDSDAKMLAPAERANVRYTVVLIAGSLPSPECHAAAIPCGGSTCIAGNDCRIGGCVPEEKVCTVDRAQWTNLNPSQSPTYFAPLQQGMDYNTVEHITAQVKAITALADQYQIGKVSLDTVLNFDPNAANDPNFAPLLADRTASQNLLQALATAGGGHFIDLSQQPLPY